MDYIVHDGKNLRMHVPEYGSEASVPLHMTKRFLLMCKRRWMAEKSESPQTTKFAHSGTKRCE